jgi:hypothetical protein
MVVSQHYGHCKFTLESILRQKGELWKFKYNLLKKKSSKRNQNGEHVWEHVANFGNILRT